MVKHLYKVMNRCPKCQARDFAVRSVAPPIYELFCDCGHVMSIPRNEVRLAVKRDDGMLLGFHHWTEKKDILLTAGTHINWDELQVA